MTMRPTIWYCALLSVVFIEAWASPADEEFREDFSRAQEGSAPAAWRILGGTWKVQGGALVGDQPEGEARALLPIEPRIDFSFEADVTFQSVAEPTRWVALTFAETRDTLRPGAPLYHTFTVRSNASARNGLEHAARTAESAWDVRVTRPYSRDLQLEETVRLEVQAVEGRVRGLIDGELVLDDALAPEVTTGELGLMVSGARVVFDDLRVRALSSAEAAALRVRRESQHRFAIIAHRGASHVAPENTMSAFKLAVEKGADGCEFDVYKTADDQLVLFHDKKLDRTSDFQKVYGSDSGKESKIEALTLEELRRLDVGSWKSPEYRGERIPTLLEALRFMAGKITPVIEIKPDDIGRQVARAIRDAEMVDDVFVQSFSPRAIRDVREELPEVPTGLLIGAQELVDPAERARDHVRRAREAGASAVVCHYRSIAPEYLRAIHRRAMAVWVYTVDDPETLALLRDVGVDGIITDVPAEAQRIRSHSVPTEVAGGLQAPTAPAPDSRSGRVDIIAGEISVLEFARYYSDALGLPLIAAGGDQRWVDKKIVLPSTVRDAAPELVKALLAENGYRITERRLREGGHVVFMSMASAAEAQTSPKETPIVEVSSTRAGRSPSPRGRRAEAPETGTIEFRGLTITTLPEVLVAQTDLVGRGGALVRARPEEPPPGGLAYLLRRFDIITHVGSEYVRSPADFKRKIERLLPGQRSSLRVLRKGKTVILPVGR